ncbi:hypothetical protein EDD22DRAFT_949965 [Suillus occidentalis]|nr:hypothetical protein EDD22DRAFT_949965 [Suillus occidentalis]
MLPFADADLLTDEGSKSDDREDSDLDCLSSSAVALEGPLMTECIFSSFFNVSAANSSRPVPGEEIPRKPDLTLLDNVEARWDTIKAVCELTSSAYKPSSTLAKTLDTKAYLLLKHQPWRQFALLISLCNGYRDLRVHLYDHSGGVISPCTNINQEPDRYLYILSCVVFGNLECIGYNTTISIFAHTLLQTLKTHSTCLLQNEGSSQDIAPTHSLGQIESTSPPPPPPQFESTSSLASTTPQIDLETEPTEDNTDEDDSSFPVEFPIEIPQDPLLEPLPEPIGKIWVNNHFYDILDIIFLRQGLVGHSTVCYHVRKNNEEFIIKDYWAIGGNKEALNEIKMMEKMKGIHGVPQLVKYWLVEVAPGKGTFCTHIRVVLKPWGRPLHKFCTKYKLLASVWDIVQIQKEAVEQCNVLHRDCSLFNAMIEDNGNGTHGMLIDWEFAVKILKNQSYTVGGTLHLKTPTDVLKLKGASSLRPHPPPLIKHCYQDNLESMFYVFIWILIEFRDPLGMKCILNKSHNWIPHEWSALKFKMCCDSKTSFFWHNEHYVKELTEQIHPYFKSLIPVVLDWYELMKNPKNVHFDNVLTVLNKHLADLPMNEPSPELLVSRRLLRALKEQDEKDEKEGPHVEEKSVQSVAGTLPGNKNKRVIDY